MRQIHICAWLLVMCSAIAACNGQEFAPNDQSGTDDSSPSATKGSSAGRSSVISGSAMAGTSQGNADEPPGYSNAGSSTAGNPGAGGTGSSSGGGGPVSGGGSNEDCATGSVTFKMLPGPDLPDDYLCDAGCGTGWLTITDAAGATAFSIFSACGAASCESCEPLPCAAGACSPTALTAEGSELVWTGTYLAQGTCGNNMACQRRTCMPAGTYKAKACAAVSAGSGLGGGCMPKDDAHLCVEAEFDFPETNAVELVLSK